MSYSTISLGGLGSIEANITFCDRCCYSSSGNGGSTPPGPSIFNGTHLINGTIIKAAVPGGIGIYLRDGTDTIVMPCPENIKAYKGVTLMGTIYPSGAQKPGPTKLMIIVASLALVSYII